MSDPHKLLLELLPLRNRQNDLHRQFVQLRSACTTPRNVDSRTTHYTVQGTPGDPSLTALHDTYTTLFQSSTHELKLLNDVAEVVKKLLSRRKDGRQAANGHQQQASPQLNGKSDLHVDLSSVTHHDGDIIGKTVPHGSMYNQQYGNGLAQPSPTSSSTSQSLQSYTSLQPLLQSAAVKGDIWSSPDGLPIGCRVAALTDVDSQPKLWMLGQIKAYRTRPRVMYEVVDTDTSVDEAAGDRRKTYLVDPARVMALPFLRDIPTSKRKEFSLNQRVLAVFPDATVLYPAYVTGQPKKRKCDTYELAFDDDEEPTREVSVEDVCPMPQQWAE